MAAQTVNPELSRRSWMLGWVMFALTLLIMASVVFVFT